MVLGAVAIGLGHRTGLAPLSWQLPALHVPPVQFTPAAFVAVSLPLVVLSDGLGTVQGLGFLVGQGYRVPVDRVTVVVGLSSVVNALFGGHPAITSRSGIPIVAGPDAGPKAGRCWASLIAGALSLLIALAARPLAALLGILPASYVLSGAGLAMLSAFQNALEQAFSGPLRFGALVAFVVAASPVSCWGLPMAVWALVAGLQTALLAECHDLLAYWRQLPTPCGTSRQAQRA